MNRNLDLSTLRSLVAIAEVGGMTSAANHLHMTQSAISMQIKRLETTLGIKVLERANRKVRPTPEGEQLLSYARRMLALNDEAWGRLTGPQYEGTISLAVPGDLVHPHIPRVLSAFAFACPRAKIKLTTGLTIELLGRFDKGQHDIVLTTELKRPEKGELLALEQLVWVGALQGRAYSERPLPVGFTNGCSFQPAAITALEKAGIDWTNAVDADDYESGIVSVAADMAVTAEMSSWRHPSFEEIEPGILPDLPSTCVMMYESQTSKTEVSETLCEILRNTFNASV